jgi:hypothetical protein
MLQLPGKNLTVRECEYTKNCWDTHKNLGVANTILGNSKIFIGDYIKAAMGFNIVFGRVTMDFSNIQKMFLCCQRIIKFDNISPTVYELLNDGDKFAIILSQYVKIWEKQNKEYVFKIAVDNVI